MIPNLVVIERARLCKYASLSGMREDMKLDNCVFTAWLYPCSPLCVKITVGQPVDEARPNPLDMWL